MIIGHAIRGGVPLQFVNHVMVTRMRHRCDYMLPQRGSRVLIAVARYNYVHDYAASG